MYKKIMVAIDGSDISAIVLQEAIKLADSQKAHLRVVHVVDERVACYGGPGFDFALIAESLQKEGQNIIDHAFESIKKQPSVKYDSALLELKPFQGRIAEVIVEEVDRWNADLLVLGTHGRSGFSHLFIGSVAEQVIRIATTPMMLIKGKYK
jgi:nucleotide-binding universal stress UspA family protein